MTPSDESVPVRPRAVVVDDDPDIGKILGRNWMRLFQQVWGE